MSKLFLYNCTKGLERILSGVRHIFFAMYNLIAWILEYVGIAWLTKDYQ